MSADQPEPLVPFDCDLRGLPWMPLDSVRLLDSDLFALSTGDEFKAAVALWCKAWQQIPAASLPDDCRILARLSGAGSKWRKVRDQALRGFVKCSDGRLYHPVIAEKALQAWEHRKLQRNRAAKRWHPGNAAAHAAAYATASPTAMQETGEGQGNDKKPQQQPAAAAVEKRLIPPNNLSNGQWPLIKRSLEGHRYPDAQLFLDELAGALSTGKVKDPIALLKAFVKEHAAGTFVPSHAHRVQAEREGENVRREVAEARGRDETAVVMRGNEEAVIE